MYIKKNRTSEFTVRIKNGQVVPEDMVMVNVLKSATRGTGTSVRLRGRKPIPGIPHYSRGRTGYQDLPLRYAQEADVYVSKVFKYNRK